MAQALMHALYEVTVIDFDLRRLAAPSVRYDVSAVEGDGTTKEVVRKAGVHECDLFVGCSPREQADLICAMLVKRLGRAAIVEQPL